MENKTKTSRDGASGTAEATGKPGKRKKKGGRRQPGPGKKIGRPITPDHLKMIPRTILLPAWWWPLIDAYLAAHHPDQGFQPAFRAFLGHTFFVVFPSEEDKTEE